LSSPFFLLFLLSIIEQMISVFGFDLSNSLKSQKHILTPNFAHPTQPNFFFIFPFGFPSRGFGLSAFGRESHPNPHSPKPRNPDGNPNEKMKKKLVFIAKFNFQS
jgi:hypothetical protein